MKHITETLLCQITNGLNRHTWIPASWFADQVQDLCCWAFLTVTMVLYFRNNWLSQYITRLLYHFNIWISFRFWLYIYHKFVDHFLTQLLILTGITSYSVRYWHLQTTPSSDMSIFLPLNIFKIYPYLVRLPRTQILSQSISLAPVPVPAFLILCISHRIYTPQWYDFLLFMRSSTVNVTAHSLLVVDECLLQKMVTWPNRIILFLENYILSELNYK